MPISISKLTVPLKARYEKLGKMHCHFNNCKKKEIPFELNTDIVVKKGNRGSKHYHLECAKILNMI